MADLASMSPEELKAQIAALERQLQQTGVQPQSSYTSSYDEYEEVYEDEEYYEEEVVVEQPPTRGRAPAPILQQPPPDHDRYRRDMENLKKQHGWQKPSWAGGSGGSGSGGAPAHAPAHRPAVPAPASQPAHRPAARAAPTPVLQQPPHSPGHDASAYARQMEDLKNQHGWQKPNWASSGGEKEVVTKSDVGGYQRHVTPKNVEIIKGQHVKPASNMEPRLAWIVVNLNRKKVGKLVMHLYGRKYNKELFGLLELVAKVRSHTVSHVCSFFPLQKM
jgi:hypothetical protein